MSYLLGENLIGGYGTEIFSRLHTLQNEEKSLLLLAQTEQENPPL